MGLRNGQWPKQDANLGHEILAPAVGVDEIWMAGWLAFARENGMRAAVRLGFLEKGSLAGQGMDPSSSSFAASSLLVYHGGLFLWSGEEGKLPKIDTESRG